MPYAWTSPTSDTAELTLWPHNALPAKGFAAMVLGFFALASLPLYGLLGTALLWGVLPFMLAATAALYYALQRNYADRQITEVLTVTPNTTALTRRTPKGPPQDWQANTYWVTVALYKDEGPVPHYVTLKGDGREVEIGAFLSEDERKALYDDLSHHVARAAAPPRGD